MPQEKRGTSSSTRMTDVTIEFSLTLNRINVSHAICDMRHAICDMLHATCYVLNSTCYMLPATRYMLHATCYKLRATRYTLHAIHYILHATLLHATVLPCYIATCMPGARRTVRADYTDQPWWRSPPVTFSGGSLPGAPNVACNVVCSNVQCTYMPQAQVMALWLHWPCAWGCQKKIFQNCATGDIWNPSYQKRFGKYFFGRGKMFAMPGVGPRPACHIPDPRDSWQQRTLWFSHVIASQAVIPGLQWYLKIGIC